MKPLRQRNQAAVGAVTMVIMVLGVLTAYYSDQVPLLNRDTTYSAYFAESAGLLEGDDVQVAGVKVGEVSSTSLAGKQVQVTFAIHDTKVGNASTASIEIKTLLGEKYLALQPRGSEQQDPNESIPVQRTRTPFQLQDAFKQLSTTVQDVDTEQLARSFTVISEGLKDTPEPMREALDGLSSLSTTVASRDQELSNLLSNTSQISKTLSSRNVQLQKVIGDGNLLLDELQKRKNAISELLRGAQSLSEQLSGVVTDNREQIGPALDKLGTVTDVLHENQDNLNRSLELLAPFTRVGTNATGNGRWFEGYFCGLVPPRISAGGVTINPGTCSPPLAPPNQGVGPK